MKKKKRVVLIGLDGATFNIIDTLPEGTARGMRDMIKRGTSAVLNSTQPALTAPAWTTFMTGKNPGKHGMYGLLKKGKGLSFGIAGAQDCKSRTIWQILEQAGKKVVLVNLPMTYPPMPVNGFLVSGYPTPPGSRYTYPENLQSDLESKGLGHNFDHSTSLNRQDRLDAVFKSQKRHFETAIYLSGKIDWDVLMIVFDGTDILGHILPWENDGAPPRELCHMYELVDDLVVELTERLGNDCLKMIISDHGFGKSPCELYMNEWLRKEGYGVRKSRIREHLGKLGLTRGNVVRIFKQLHVYSFVKSKIGNLPENSWLLPRFGHRIDEKKVMAFCPANGMHGIYLNDILLSGSDYEKLREELIEKLRKAVNPKSHKKIFKKVSTREEVYHGDYVKDAPDIVLTPDDECRHILAESSGEDIIKISDKGAHFSEGIFIAQGGCIKSGQRIGNIALPDIAPTVLHFMDVGIPSDMDGTVVMDIFRKDSEAHKRPVRDVEPAAVEGGKTEKMSQLEHDNIKQRLQELGYI